MDFWEMPFWVSFLLSCCPGRLVSDVLLFPPCQERGRAGKVCLLERTRDSLLSECCVFRTEAFKGYVLCRFRSASNPIACSYLVFCPDSLTWAKFPFIHIVSSHMFPAWSLCSPSLGMCTCRQELREHNPISCLPTPGRREEKLCSE